MGRFLWPYLMSQSSKHFLYSASTDLTQNAKEGPRPAMANQQNPNFRTL